MRFVMCVLVSMLIVVLAGCGGGGGGATSSLSQVPMGIVGTWQVPGLGLPDDEMGVQSDGDVVVNSEEPANRSGSQTRIGVCNPDGTLVLNGSWQSDGVDYTISASGRVEAQSHSLTIQATIVTSSGERMDYQGVSGDRISDMELPPPPPGDPWSDDGIEYPPPPPGDPSDELPPPPPSF